MSEQRVIRIRKKKRISLKMILALACATAIVATTFGSGSRAVTVEVPSQGTANSGWGDATASNANANTADSTESTTAKKPQKTLTLSTAKGLAHATSDKLDALDEKLVQQEAKYEDKVKAAAIKREYVKHFHWKFLLSFDLPRDLTFEEIRTLTYEPEEALQECKQIKQDMEDLKMELNEKVTDLYITIYKGRQSNELDNERLLIAKDKLAKVGAMMATGEKNEDDYKEAEQTVKNLESKISSDIVSTNASCKKLAKLVGFVDDFGNVTDPELSEYKLQVPYSTDIIKKLDRKDLAYLKKYTLDHDVSIFEARGAKTLAYLDVTTVYEAIKGNMKWNDMMIIYPYYQAAIQGRTINKRDLKKANKEFLKAVDIYWDGDYKIGFWPFLFSIPKEWFKGKSDGTWYMMDSPDALYECILEYSSATTELRNAESDKEDAVEEAFNTYIGLRNSLTTIQEQKADKETGYRNAGIQYRIGEIDATEYNSILTTYEDLELQELDSLTTFSQNVNSFNKITCGALDKILSGDDLENEFGTQLVVANNIEGASYYIVPKYESLVFDLGINVPDDFSINISDFELWCDGTKIGKRTPKDQVIEHLMQATANVEKVVVRLYDNENFIADCEIDAGVLQGPLKIPKYTGNVALEGKVGTYELDVNEEMGTCILKLIPDLKENMGFFVIYDANGKAVGGETKRKVDEGIQYLNSLSKSMKDVTIKCYDKDEQYLYDATFNLDEKAVIKKS